LPVIVRDALAADIPAIMRLKRALAIADSTGPALRATAADWARDGFGPQAHFMIFVADGADGIVGMAICAERRSPGWVGPLIVLHDLCVEEAFRGLGVGSALLARVATLAKTRGSVMLELTVRSGNRAAILYERAGFVAVPEACNYVLAGAALDTLASEGRRAD
jgi:ribosomal protein S18 acetylase RimI-like enzyme